MSTGTTETRATKWQIDPVHTQVEFEVRHMMFAKVRGRFGTFGGTMVLGVNGEVSDAEVEVVIDAASIDTGHEQRDEHLRSDDFLGVDQYPELRFASTGVREAGDGTLYVTGDLSIHGVTKPVELEVSETGRGTDPWGNERWGFSASTTIDRRDYGLTWNQALETGGVLVGHDVTIELEVQAVPQED